MVFFFGMYQTVKVEITAVDAAAFMVKVGSELEV